MSKSSLVILAILVAGLGILAPLAGQAQQVPAPYPIDFCGILDQLGVAFAPGGGLAWFTASANPYVGFLDDFGCSLTDINGPFQNNVPGPNGLLDGPVELGLLQELINAPNDYSHLRFFGGVDAQMAREAYLANYALLYSDGLHALLFGSLSTYWPLIATLHPAIPDNYSTVQTPLENAIPPGVQLLAGYATLGDVNSVHFALYVADQMALCGLVLPNACLINDIPLDPNAYTSFGEFLGATGDADGDGFTNVEEHNAFSLKSAGGFLGAMLNPRVNPVTPLGDDYHPADTNRDGALSISEVTGYGSAWKQGAAWSTPPSTIPISYVTNAGFLWVSGETYTKADGAEPGCWQYQP